MNRAERVSDFEWRIEDSDSAYVHHNLGWRYIPINPFADEPAILERLKIAPADCVKADAYWEVDGDIIFLETIASAHIKREPGLYCRTRAEGGNVAFAVLDTDSISRGLFEEIMIRFHETGRLTVADDCPTQDRPLEAVSKSAERRSFVSGSPFNRSPLFALVVQGGFV